jgi:pimeloyl-ACP methyl ester carboxylesterase
MTITSKDWAKRIDFELLRSSGSPTETADRYCRAVNSPNKTTAIRLHYSLARVIHPSVLLLFALGPLLAALPTREAEAATPAVVTLVSCQLEDPLGISVVPAECGALSVPENPSDPQGRRIILRVARVPAINRRKQPDPLFVFAGGPGMGATTFYASAAFAFERIHRDRDIVLVDQRGTGQSNPLNCAQDDNDLYRSSDTEVLAEAKRCLDALGKRARVEFYTTSVAVRDLDLVRAALGYERINLYGVSYGTRVAQHYLRRFPKHTRSVILDGVVPPQLALGPASALNAESALIRILARCAHEAACHARFGDSTVSYHTLRASLQAHPVAVNIPDPTSGRSSRFEFTGYHLATVLRLGSYTAEQAALLPLLLHGATNSADFTALAAQFLLMNRSYGEALAYGMHNSVVCSEDVPFYDLAKIDRVALETTYLGTTQLDGLRNICSIWPRGPVDADFHSPLHSDVPVLLLSGSDDPVTPPTDAEQARRGFTRSVHIVLQGFGRRRCECFTQSSLRTRAMR